ncbi:hypothetical protein GGR54DRAFT_640779 [Hypoxylon sp. NC1633]|nr:hypothetical protein GGR54DRAFT_640779 [Hypoxylon sp. NC1633]
MSSTEAKEAPLSVDQIATMSDADLGLFIKTHHRPDGNYELPIDGWEKLSKDERNRLAERLKAQQRGLSQSPTAYSRPLDLDELDARLCQVSPNDSSTIRPESQIIERSEPPTPPPDPELGPLRFPIICYHELVQEGGRPLFPVDIILDVNRDPEKYGELLRPWMESPDSVSATRIFQRQRNRWHDFRKWQYDNRDLDDDSDTFLAFVEQRKHVIQRDYLPETQAKRLAEIEADPSCLRPLWEVVQLGRERQMYHCRERGCKGFRDYTTAVKRRLTRHGFTQPFELNEDPKKQDKLTTWVEYLNYEYWWLDKFTSDIERLEPGRDKAWQELVDKKILKSHETMEFVRTVASGIEIQTEKDQAWKAVQRAESEAKRIYWLTQKDPERLRIPQAKRISMLSNGTENLLAARRWLERTQNRGHLILQYVQGTWDHDDARRDAICHRRLVQWVLDQVPLVEAEMNQSRPNRPEPDGRKSTKRRLTNDEEPLERHPKRAMLDFEGPRLASTKAPSNATEMQPESPIVTHQDTSQGSQADKFAVGCLHQDDTQGMSR